MQADLPPIIPRPIARKTSVGWDAATVARLMQVQSVSGDQADSYRGATELSCVYFDQNAAGHGRFVDPTPGSDEEFAASRSDHTLRAVDPRAVDRIDLVTVAEHKLGPVAGFDDPDALADNMMSDWLGTSVRWNPFVDCLDPLLAVQRRTGAEAK